MDDHYSGGHQPSRREQPFSPSVVRDSCSAHVNPRRTGVDRHVRSDHIHMGVTPAKLRIMMPLR